MNINPGDTIKANGIKLIILDKGFIDLFKEGVVIEKV